MGLDSKYDRSLEQRAKKGRGSIDFQWIAENESADSVTGKILAEEDGKLRTVTNRIMKLRRGNY